MFENLLLYTWCEHLKKLIKCRPICLIYGFSLLIVSDLSARSTSTARHFRSAMHVGTVFGRVTSEQKVSGLMECTVLCADLSDCVHYAYSSTTNMCHAIVPDGCGTYLAASGWLQYSFNWHCLRCSTRPNCSVKYLFCGHCQLAGKICRKVHEFI